MFQMYNKIAYFDSKKEVNGLMGEQGELGQSNLT